MKKIRVLIVDDHALIRDGLKALLRSVNEIQITGEASNGLEAIEKVKSARPDVVLMDIRMPKMNGLEALKEIKKISGKTKVILLSTEVSEEYINEAINNGAQGYLPKNIKKTRLVEAILRVYHGEDYFDPSVSDVIFKSHLKKPLKGQVKKHLAQGKRKIALELIAILSLELLAGVILGFIGF